MYLESETKNTFSSLYSALIACRETGHDIVRASDRKLVAFHDGEKVRAGFGANEADRKDIASLRQD